MPGDLIEILLDYPQLSRRLAEVEDMADTAIVKRVANLFSSVLLAEENASLLNDPLPTAPQFIELCTMLEKNELSSTAGKTVLLELFGEQQRGKSPRELAKELNLLQENDAGALEALVDAVLANPATQQAQADYKAGQEKVLGFLVGQVMKESHGKANPAAVSNILKKKLA